MKVIITPQLAKDILASNTINRPMKKSNLEFIEKQLRSGEFAYNGESIKISSSNLLLDGQHRLQAVINTGISIVSEVVYDLDQEVFKTIDTGVQRSAADTLNVSGVSMANKVAATIKRLLAFQQNSHRVSLKHKISNSDVLHVYESSPELFDDTITEINNIYVSGQNLISPSLMSAFVIASLMKRKNKGLLIAFVHELYTGKNTELSNGSTAAANLRNLLITFAVSRDKVIEQKYIVRYLFDSFAKYEKVSTAQKYNLARVKKQNYSEFNLPFQDGKSRKLVGMA